ncbi:hypothetical protein SUGI_1524190 [Cryptomeria japonica]|uniref:Uncharacterized protein n=1 Tax=Cryptomeria japonica TaxID=3369 RepID=A0AAD3NUZ6_CRYJA|nr:uncharacterized protein LOC131030317 [Cryptomeria japonica]GLJ59823.1 hypothetical protein SUGI_1524190 [Cryptomeria japonica]
MFVTGVTRHEGTQLQTGGTKFQSIVKAINNPWARRTEPPSNKPETTKATGNHPAKTGNRHESPRGLGKKKRRKPEEQRRGGGRARTRRGRRISRRNRRRRRPANAKWRRPKGAEGPARAWKVQAAARMLPRPVEKQRPKAEDQGPREEEQAAAKEQTKRREGVHGGGRSPRQRRGAESTAAGGVHGSGGEQGHGVPRAQSAKAGIKPAWSAVKEPEMGDKNSDPRASTNSDKSHGWRRKLARKPQQQRD